MSAEQIQMRLDEMFPRGATMTTFWDDDAPEAQDNPQYHIPRLLVVDATEDGYTLLLDPAGEDRIFYYTIVAEENYGPQTDIVSVILKTSDETALWMTSHVTDAMNKNLREFERTRSWFEASQRMSP